MVLTGTSSPRTGIFSLANKITRQLPTSTDNVTHETIHPSVLEQDQILPQLKANLDRNPNLISELLPFEEDTRKNWPYVPGKHPPKDAKSEGKPENATSHKSVLNMAVEKGTELRQQTLHGLTHSEVMKDASGNPVYEKSWLARRAEETPFGGLLSHWTDGRQ